MRDSDDRFDRWLEAALARHTSSLRPPELLKAIRALSARYVESRASLPARSPLDSAGKRAAFAAFYAPLHYLTTREVVRALGLHRAPIRRIADLGCGTGAAGAAWAAALTPEPVLDGVDAHPWAVAEAAWTWRTLGVRGRARRGDLVRAAEALRADRRAGAHTAVVLGWAVNELRPDARARLLPILTDLASRGVVVLVIEPIARSLTPWWDEWAAGFHASGGRADDWRFALTLPTTLTALDEMAGFRRESLTARTLLACRR